MNNASETDALKKDMEQLKRDLSTLSDSVKQSASQRAQAGVDSARGTYDDLKRQADRQAQDLGSEIEARPFASIFVAFGVGLVLGKLVGR